MLGKFVGELLAITMSGRGNMFLIPGSYALLAATIVAVLGQIHYLNEGTRRFASVYILPVFQAIWMVTSVIAGLVIFEEWAAIADSWHHPLSFTLGIAAALGGVYWLMMQPTRSAAQQRNGVSKGPAGHGAISGDGVASGSDDDGGESSAMLPGPSPHHMRQRRRAPKDGLGSTTADGGEAAHVSGGPGTGASGGDLGGDHGGAAEGTACAACCAGSWRACGGSRRLWCAPCCCRCVNCGCGPASDTREDSGDGVGDGAGGSDDEGGKGDEMAGDGGSAHALRLCPGVTVEGVCNGDDGRRVRDHHMVPGESRGVTAAAASAPSLQPTRG